MLYLISKKSKLMHRVNKKTLKILSKSDIDTRNASKFMEFVNRNSCIHVYHMYVIDVVLRVHDCVLFLGWPHVHVHVLVACLFT